MPNEHKTSKNVFDESIYQKLKVIANKLMLHEHHGHTLSPTDLVHEAYLQLSKNDSDDCSDHAYLFILARQMRRLLIDYGRRKSRIKHGGKVKRVIFTEGLQIASKEVLDFEMISHAIDDLETASERCAQIIELLYFTGISREKTAEMLNISMSTLAREVRFAKAYIGDILDDSSTT